MKKLVKLIEPEKKYWKSFWGLVRENKKEGIYSWFKERNWKEYKKKIEKDKNKKRIWWLVRGEVVVGRGGLRLKKSKRGTVLYNIRPSQRSKGYGKLILRLLIKKTRKMGWKKMEAVCRKENQRSRRVIEGQGGKLIRREKNKLVWEVKV